MATSKSWVVNASPLMRECARSHELPLIGSLGILLRARRLGLIPAARPLIDELMAQGSFLDKALVERELAKLGE